MGKRLMLYCGGQLESRREHVERHILDDIPFVADPGVAAKRVRVEQSGPLYDELVSFVKQAETVSRPKAMYRVGYLGERGEDWVTIGEQRFTSRILRVNLEPVHRVFVYLVTCGAEIQEWAQGRTDPLEQYWSNVVQEMALGAASRALSDHLNQLYEPGRTSTMAPGSLGEWPLSEQRPLFSLLRDTVEAIGVRLSESLLMVPTKSVSGIRFATEEQFESCQLCPRSDCPGRRAPYDDELFERKYSAVPG
jgi:hypothetical protein